MSSATVGYRGATFSRFVKRNLYLLRIEDEKKIKGKPRQRLCPAFEIINFIYFH